MNQSTAPIGASRDLKGWAVFIFLAFVWGGSFVLIKKGLIHFSAIEVASLRISISAMAFAPVFIFSKVRFPKGRVLLITLVVFLGNGITAFLFALAETRLGSAVTGVLNSLTPIFALVTGVLFFGLKFKNHHLLGIVLGCIGITVLMLGEDDWRISSYVFYVVLATFCYGLSANMVKRYCQDIHPIAITAIGFFSLGCFGLVILGMTGGYAKMIESRVWVESMIPLMVLALFCTVIANILFIWLLQRTTAVFGSSIAYAIPCMALVWGGLDGEVISWFQIAGFVFIITAVYALRRH